MLNKVKYTLGDGVELEVFLKEGVVHNDFGPAFTLVTKDGLRLDLHFRDGLLHKDNGPAVEAEKWGAGRVPIHFRDGTLAPMAITSGKPRPPKPR